MLIAITVKGGKNGYLFIGGLPFPVENTGISSSGNIYAASGLSLPSGYVPTCLYLSSTQSVFGLQAANQSDTRILSVSDVSDTFAFQCTGNVSCRELMGKLKAVGTD